MIKRVKKRSQSKSKTKTKTKDKRNLQYQQNTINNKMMHFVV
jgi:hypothetical protein